MGDACVTGQSGMPCCACEYGCLLLAALCSPLQRFVTWRLVLTGEALGSAGSAKQICVAGLEPGVLS